MENIEVRDMGRSLSWPAPPRVTDTSKPIRAGIFDHYNVTLHYLPM